jgi:hypothetical protein
MIGSNFFYLKGLLRYIRRLFFSIDGWIQFRIETSDGIKYLSGSSAARSGKYV